MNNSSVVKIAFLAAAAASLCSASAATTELLTNGNFETGTFTGWTVAKLSGSSGSFDIDTPGTTTPSSGQLTAPGLLQNGRFYAVTDQVGPGTHSLIQSFNVPAGVSSVTLAFEMFVNDTSRNLIVGSQGLNHNGRANQHARVDLLSSAAGDFDTGAGVISNFYLGTDPLATNPFKSYSFNITGLVAPGGTYKIRFAEVDNQGIFNQGVDNVSVKATTGGRVPDTGSTVLLLGLSICSVLSITGIGKKNAR